MALTADGRRPVSRLGACWVAAPPAADRLRCRLCESLECPFNTSVERRISPDHVAKTFGGHLARNGNAQHGEHLAATRPRGGAADQDTAVGILDELDEAVVAGAVNETTGRIAERAVAGANAHALFSRLRLGHDHGAHLGVGEGDP